MKIYLFLLGYFLTTTISAQQFIEVYDQLDGYIKIGKSENDTIPLGERGFILILPDNLKMDNLNGVIISIDDFRFDRINYEKKRMIYPEAISHGFAVLRISSGVPIDLFFSKSSITYVHKELHMVFQKYQLPTNNVFLLGVNTSGHRALKYLEFSKQNKDNLDLNFRGVVLCDSALDWVRMWYEESKAIRDNYAKSSVSEGKLVTYLLESHLKASPKENLEAYLDFSPYSYFDEKNRHITYYQDIAFRAYSEPATYYWMNEKGKGTYDTNFPDMVGIITELKLKGNRKSELITFQNDRGQNADYNPNFTWELVDKGELMRWIVSIAKSKEKN